MRKVCEVYLVSSASSDERGVELTFPVSRYEMMDAFEQIHTKSPGDVYWQVDEFYCFDYLAPHLDESMSIFEFNSLTEQLSKLDGYQETALEGLLQMQVNKHMQENGGPITVQELMMLAHNVDHCHVLADIGPRRICSSITAIWATRFCSRIPASGSPTRESGRGRRLQRRCCRSWIPSSRRRTRWRKCATITPRLPMKTAGSTCVWKTAANDSD